MEFNQVKQIGKKYRQQIVEFDKTIANNHFEFESLKDLEIALNAKTQKQGMCFSVEHKRYHFECMFYKKIKKNQNLYVLYNGVHIKERLPRFPRWTYYNLFSGSMLCIEDPMYYKYPDLSLGWLWGTPEESLIEISVDIIKTVCDIMGIPSEKVIFFSSSGGGYDGIYASTFLNGSMAIALNPQLYIQNYVHTPNFIKTTGYNLREKVSPHSWTP